MDIVKFIIFNVKMTFLPFKHCQNKNKKNRSIEGKCTYSFVGYDNGYIQSESNNK